VVGPFNPGRMGAGVDLLRETAKLSNCVVPACHMKLCGSKQVLAVGPSNILGLDQCWLSAHLILLFMQSAHICLLACCSAGA
jgi:hypothetical protein